MKTNNKTNCNDNQSTKTSKQSKTNASKQTNPTTTLTTTQTPTNKITKKSTRSRNKSSSKVNAKKATDVSDVVIKNASILVKEGNIQHGKSNNIGVDGSYGGVGIAVASSSKCAAPYGNHTTPHLTLLTKPNIQISNSNSNSNHFAFASNSRHYNMSDAISATCSSSTSNCTDRSSNICRNQHKSYAGLEAHSIKIIWEQRDQGDIELSSEACIRLAEDASYKLWELINNIKIYARHSGGSITYDLVNEVLKDADVPPCLGALDGDWERIDYGDNYYFYSDRILELREEYQKELRFELPLGPDFKCAWPVDEKHLEILKTYMPSLLYATLNGNADELDTVLREAAESPLIGASYRLILNKIIQIIAFKQNNEIIQRCWRLLRALTGNRQCRDVDCREEYFHLSEILICQLLADEMQMDMQIAGNEMKFKSEPDDILSGAQQQDDGALDSAELASGSVRNSNQQNPDESNEVTEMNSSPYYAAAINWNLVNELCDTLGHLAALNSYFQSECTFNILRRLRRFFTNNSIRTEKDYNYICRAISGLFALGEHPFREFIPFLYKIPNDEIIETSWNFFAVGAIYLQGSDDIFLYEWLQFVCGADKLQPFTTYFADYFEKFLIYRYCKRKQATYRLTPKLSVRRLEWSSLVAAMCHGDDPNKALKPKPTLNEFFPESALVKIHSKRSAVIRFKFAGCRPLNKSKQKSFTHLPLNTTALQTSLTTAIVPAAPSLTAAAAAAATTLTDCPDLIIQHDILIARRRQFKPLTNEKTRNRICSFYYTTI